VRFRSARQIINYTVLQDFQFSWPGPAVEVTGQLCTFQQCCGFISQQKYLNSVQVSDWMLPLAFPSQHGRTSKPTWKRACISFHLTLWRHVSSAASYHSDLCGSEPLVLREFRTTQK